MLTIDGGIPAILLDDVASVSIQTYDPENRALPRDMNAAECADVRRIGVSLTVGRSGIRKTFATRVFVRGAMVGGGT